MKNPVGILVSGPNESRKWVALEVDKNKLWSRQVKNQGLNRVDKYENQGQDKRQKNQGWLKKNNSEHSGISECKIKQVK